MLSRQLLKALGSLLRLGVLLFYGSPQVTFESFATQGFFVGFASPVLTVNIGSQDGLLIVAGHGSLGIHELAVELALQRSTRFAVADLLAEVAVQGAGKLLALAYQVLIVAFQLRRFGFGGRALVARGAVIYEE